MESFKYIEHEADIGINASGHSMEELFENIALGMFSIMWEINNIKSDIKRQVVVSEERKISREELLVNWLEMLIYNFEVRGEIYSSTVVEDISISSKGSFLRSNIFGEKVNSEKHVFKIQVKAPTYHLLKIEGNAKNKKFSTSIIFDV